MKYEISGNTIGEVIQSLVDTFGGTTGGIYILGQALVRSAYGKDNGVLVTIDRKLVHECPRHKELQAQEDANWAVYEAYKKLDEAKAHRDAVCGGKEV